MQVEEMNKNEIQNLEKILVKNYGYSIDFSNFRVFKNKEGKIYLLNKINVNSQIISRASYLGLYFGKIKRNEKIQLSVEGSQMIGKYANKNIAILDRENAERFMEGLNCKWVELINCEVNNFVLIKFGEDFFGSGILRENHIESLIPKGRRIMKELKKI
ncbi:MAG: hypothetical protein QXW01_02860 [Candidatus Aenigmatarchaeota archaeon]